MNSKPKGCARIFLTALLVLTGLCLVLAVASVISNRSLPTQSTVVNQLSPVDKSRLAEADHLRQTLGDSVLPGWSQANIPTVLYNEENLFLVGTADPTEGWEAVTSGKQLGTAWQRVPDDDFYSQPYFMQPIPPSGETTQAFTVRIGEDWASSMPTLDWMKIGLVNSMREDVPGPLKPIVPFRVVTALFVPNSDTHITAVLHEAAHAYQGILAPERLAAAENANLQNEGHYPWEDEALIENWQTELDILRDAMRAGTDEEKIQLARAFLDQRAARRAAANLPANLIEYERHREWVEGIAKYAERLIYIQAANTEEYSPLPEMQQDPEFQDYRGAQRKWDQEVDQISRMASDPGDGRFYYSGFAQAALLDKLSPGWKDRLFEDDVWLEDLLSEAVQ